MCAHAKRLGLVVAMLGFLGFAPPAQHASAQSDRASLAARVAELEAQVEELTAILQFVRVEADEINGLAGPHWIVEGANVHVRSGSGATNDSCASPRVDPGFPNCESLTGLGNLIVGYNERVPSLAPVLRDMRTGSHNLIVGEWHSYSSFAGFVAGKINHVVGPNASVSGGHGNVASGAAASICGGNQNRASGFSSSVSGGQVNEASGTSSSVSGGSGNLANDDESSVSGGAFNRATGPRSSISGGRRNKASGSESSVSGGEANAALGFASSVSGGRSNDATGSRSSVSGGRNRTAPRDLNWAAGSLLEPN